MSFDLHYVSTGSGIPFFFQHGLGAELNQAQGLLSGLNNIQLISMDCRGHGKSPLPADFLPSFDTYTDDLVRLMDHLGIKEAIFGGISMGAGISLNMAIRYPARVKSLVLVRPAWLELGRPANLEILLEVIPFLDQPKGRKDFGQIDTYQKIKAELPKAAASILGQFTREQGTATARILKHMVEDAPFKKRDDLKRLQQASIIIANQDDPLHPFEFAEIITANLPGGTLKKVTSRYVNNTGHQNEVRQLVASFLEKEFI